MCLRPHSGCPCSWSYVSKKNTLQKALCLAKVGQPNISVFSMQLSTDHTERKVSPMATRRRWHQKMRRRVVSSCYVTKRKSKNMWPSFLMSLQGWICLRRPESWRKHHLLIDPEDHNSPSPSKGWLINPCPATSSDRTPTLGEP